MNISDITKEIQKGIDKANEYFKKKGMKSRAYNPVNVRIEHKQKPRIRCKMIGDDQGAFWVAIDKCSLAYLEDVYEYGSFDKAFWARMWR